MKNNNSSIKPVVAVGIGAALFFVLGRFVAIPSPVPNTNISLQYAVLALLAAMYGPVAGGLIGFIGHTLIDLSWGGIPWWSWVITSAFVGVVVGLFTKKLHVEEGDFNKKKVGVFALANVIQLPHEPSVLSATSTVAVADPTIVLLVERSITSTSSGDNVYSGE